jgi:hypothetical protein
MIAGKNEDAAGKRLQQIKRPPGKIGIDGVIVKEITRDNDEMDLLALGQFANFFERLKTGFADAVGDFLGEARDAQPQVEVSGMQKRNHFSSGRNQYVLETATGAANPFLPS